MVVNRWYYRRVRHAKAVNPIRLERERERERNADADGASRGAVNTLPFAIFNPAPLSIIPPIFVSLEPISPSSSSRVGTVTPWLGCARRKKKKKRKKMGRISGVETIGPKIVVEREGVDWKQRDSEIRIRFGWLEKVFNGFVGFSFEW